MYNYNDMKISFEQSPIYNIGIKLPKQNTQKSETLLYFFNNVNKILKKSDIEREVCLSLNIPTKDIQDVRHLSKQNGFNILQGGEEFRGVVLKRGEYCFLGFNEPNKYWSFSRRSCDVDFDELKKKYNYSCATCGAKENTKHRYTNQKVTLERGHMNPNKELTIDNIIPQCEYCNTRYKNKFIFDELGGVKNLTDDAYLNLPNKEKERLINLLKGSI